MSTMIAPCIISAAKVVRMLSCKDPHGPLMEILIESRAGSWRVSRSKQDLVSFLQRLECVFIVEAGKRGHVGTLPTLRAGHDEYKFWKGSREKATLLLRRCNSFLNSILSLPPYISRSRCVLDFLLPWGDRDQPAIIIYEDCHGQAPKSLSSGSNQLVPSAAKSAPRMIKFKIASDTDTIVVCYRAAMSPDYEMLLADVSAKLSARKDVCRLTYRDCEDDDIQIHDNADLQAAISMGCQHRLSLTLLD